MIYFVRKMICFATTLGYGSITREERKVVDLLSYGRCVNMRKSVFLAGIFMLLASPWKVSGSTTGITIKASENIVKYQLGTIRTKVIKKDLEEILEGLEGVVPVDSSEKLDRGDDFLSILLI